MIASINPRVQKGATCVDGGGFYWVRFAPVTVDRHSISSGEILVEVFGTGYLEAHTKATVSSKIPGRLTSVGVDQGDFVHAGQVLAHLDDLDLKHEVEIEAANVIAHKAGIDRLAMIWVRGLLTPWAECI